MALGELGFRVTLRGPHTVVELGDMSAAILGFGNLAFKCCVVDGMILHLHRHALDLRVVAGALGNGPALQRVTHLQTEVVVPAAGMMQLHHENGALAFWQRLARFGLPGLVKTTLAAVLDQ